MSDESYKVFRGADPDRIIQIIEAAGKATACTVDDKTYPNQPLPVVVPDQP